MTPKFAPKCGARRCPDASPSRCLTIPVSSPPRKWRATRAASRWPTRRTTSSAWGCWPGGASISTASRPRSAISAACAPIRAFAPRGFPAGQPPVSEVARGGAGAVLPGRDPQRQRLRPPSPHLRARRACPPAPISATSTPPPSPCSGGPPGPVPKDLRVVRGDRWAPRPIAAGAAAVSDARNSSSRSTPARIWRPREAVLRGLRVDDFHVALRRRVGTNSGGAWWACWRAGTRARFGGWWWPGTREVSASPVPRSLAFLAARVSGRCRPPEVRCAVSPPPASPIDNNDPEIFHALLHAAPACGTRAGAHLSHGRD